MKKGLLVLGVLSAMVFTSCKEDAASKVKEENVEVAAARDAQATVYPVIAFDESEFDFGNIEKGTTVEHKFTFTNTGKAPLVIVDAKSSCGCTVPEYSKNPVAPGEKGELLVKYNGSGANQVTKTVTIKANTEKGTETVLIKAFVNPAAGAAK
ncbi:uncharacterized protein DUF1573 [Dokdonia sp. Hel_I_63]|jgi:hypothetical protein|uniref:DUF1573 domain-containing protein n=1 Tax=unclassified Dokdonia TaxID=2615033 RepID=UPI00020A62F5|nr:MULTISPECIES: DUF1573 domain-containing protein [unclassified Dokdonia]AEE20549.1 protein of unknown function DUF1573 [Dokdonia sp. 4H-3-7-5]TVZ23196.1 uncharacterized protein DUF1573 [Dokdonia sp. Hel_I_63]